MGTLPNLRRLLASVVVASVVPMLLLALGLVAAFRASGLGIPAGSTQVALLVGGTLLVATFSVWFAWRIAAVISGSIESLATAVLAASHTDSIDLPPPRFIEQHGLGQAFRYATTALHDAQEALRTREARLRTVLDTARDAIITADEEGHVVLFNRAAERMFGVSEENAIGRSLGTFIPQEHRHEHLGHMHDMSPDSAFPRMMGPDRLVRALRADGTQFPVAASISCGAAGDQRLFTAILREVAEGRLDLDVRAALPA